MGENEKFGLNLWYAGQPIMSSVADDIGMDTSGKPIYNPDTSCGTIPKHDPSHAEQMASLKAEVDALAKEYKPIVDKLMEGIYESSQKAPLLFTNPTTRKARKHYKPKFTL